jgi:hypothetical protein
MFQYPPRQCTFLICTGVYNIYILQFNNLSFLYQFLISDFLAFSVCWTFLFLLPSPYILLYLPLETTIADYVRKLFNRLRLATNFTEIFFCLPTEAHWTEKSDQKSELVANRKGEITQIFFLFPSAGSMIYRQS